MRVLKLIHKMELCSRSQLAAMSGLKQSTITNIVNRLIEYGVVRETGSFEGKKGRRSIGITLETERYQVIGVRLTRTDFSVGLFSIDGHPEQIETRQIKPEQPVEQILLDIEGTIRDLMARAPHKVVAVGMAVPGPYLANSGRVLLITGARKWEKVNFKKQLAEKFSIHFTSSTTPTPAFWRSGGTASAALRKRPISISRRVLASARGSSSTVRSFTGRWASRGRSGI